MELANNHSKELRRTNIPDFTAYDLIVLAIPNGGGIILAEMITKRWAVYFTF